MPTRITSKNYKKKQKTSTKLKSAIKLNTKCKTLKIVSQTPSVNKIFEKQKELSNKKIIADTAKDEGAIESSRSILNSLGISAISQNENAIYSIKNGEGLNTKNLETLKKTQDTNPNRIQENKFVNLKTQKIKSSDIYKQQGQNPIFDLDDCPPIWNQTKNKDEINTIELTTKVLDTTAIEALRY